MVKSTVPNDANIIGSRTIYLRDDNGTVKARIMQWGPRDVERNRLLNESPCLTLEILRLILFLSVEQKWILGPMDINTAYLQGKGFDREISVLVPKIWNDPSRLFKLETSAYGLVDNGGLCSRTSDEALVS